MAGVGFLRCGPYQEVQKNLNMTVQGSFPPHCHASRPCSQVLQARCCWQTGHLPLLGGFQFGTRKENSKWSLL